MEILKGSSVLDTSCQDGGFLSVLSSYCGDALKISGVDVSSVDISVAENRFPKGTFKVADNTSLPFEPRSFDVVISSMTLHHMKDPKQSLLEMKRVLKQSGHMYLADVVGTNKVSNFVLSKMKCSEPYHFEKFYSIDEVKQLLNDTGLTIERMERVVVFPAVSVVLPLLVMKIIPVRE